jgi:hypothetical protein
MKNYTEPFDENFTEPYHIILNDAQRPKPIGE